jgi:ABC-2 type transport system ATP-binding protein
MDTPEGLKKMVGEDQIELATQNNKQLIQLLAERYQIAATERDGKVVFETRDSDHFVPHLMAEVSQPPTSIMIEMMHIRRPTLEDVFLKLTGHVIRDEEGAKDQRRLALRQMGRL